MKNLEELEKNLGIRFKDKNLLLTALVHRSFLNEHPEYKGESNERLEFLGDAVLDFVVSEYLFKNFHLSEGEMTDIRSFFVKTPHLSETAKNLGIEKFLFLSKGEKKDKDFKYIVRISNTDINGEKNLVYGLTTIKGIGVHMATLIADAAGIDRYTKIGDLKDSEIEKLQMIIDNVNKNAPGWMVNHRKDYETGEDIHLVGSDIDMKLRDEVNIMKKIRSYRGIRHERGLPVRGQRTRSNNRKGLALGVSKKRD